MFCKDVMCSGANIEKQPELRDMWQVYEAFNSAWHSWKKKLMTRRLAELRKQEQAEDELEQLENELE